jgi:hypothetical protein
VRSGTSLPRTLLGRSVTGNPAILAYASRSVPTDRPDLGYALTFVDVLTVLFLR